MRMTQADVDAHQARHRPKQVEPKDAFTGPESDLHDKIIAECRRRRWYFVRSRMDKRSTNQAGTPDFIIAADAKFDQVWTYWIEVKRKGSKLTPEQTATKHVLLSLGHRYATIFSFEQFLSFVDA